MNEILEIKCQACKPEDSGCSTCGGYKIVLEKVRASDGTEYWTRPGRWTNYEGKRWRSFDGVPLIIKNGETVRDGGEPT